MTTINDIRKRLSAVSIKDESFKSVSDTKSSITDIQKEQLSKGLNAEGKKLRRYRSRKYAVAKNAINPLPGLGNPDLRLTGSFYAGFKTVVTPETFATTSSDSKNEALTQKYDPFGLNKESKVEYVKDLRPVFVKKVREKLRL